MARLVGTMLLLIAVGQLVACNGAPAPPALETVTIKGRTFALEVAADDASITRGLMERVSIPDDGGMLFIFPNAEPRVFWMGYCLVDIDIIFLDPMGRVTATHRMKAEAPRRPDESEASYRARMPDYSSGRAAQFAIELSAGMLDRLDVSVDDRIELDLKRLKARVKLSN